MEEDFNELQPQSKATPMEDQRKIQSKEGNIIERQPNQKTT